MALINQSSCTSWRRITVLNENSQVISKLKISLFVQVNALIISLGNFFIYYPTSSGRVSGLRTMKFIFLINTKCNVNRLTAKIREKSCFVYKKNDTFVADYAAA